MKEGVCGTKDPIPASPEPALCVYTNWVFTYCHFTVSSFWAPLKPTASSCPPPLPKQRKQSRHAGWGEGIQSRRSRSEHEGPRHFLHEDLVSTTTSPHGCYFPAGLEPTSSNSGRCFSPHMPPSGWLPASELLGQNLQPLPRSRVAEGLCPLPAITVILGTWGIRLQASAAWRDTHPPTVTSYHSSCSRLSRSGQVFPDPFQCLHTSTPVQVRAPSRDQPSASRDRTFGMSAAALAEASKVQSSASRAELLARTTWSSWWWWR